MDETIPLDVVPEGMSQQPIATPTPDLQQQQAITEQPSAPTPAPQQIEAAPLPPLATPDADAATLSALEQNDAAVKPVGPMLSGSVQYLTPFLGKGKDASHLSGMTDGLADKLTKLISEAPDTIRSGITINSGYRSPERQAELYKEAVAKYGSDEAARKWVAPPGRSNHNHGNAADIGFADDTVRKYVHDNAARYGLAFPMGHEPWHIETADARAPKVNSNVPVDIKGYLEDAAHRSGVPLHVLMGIAKQESDFGRNTKNAVGSARGLMQFMPPTWDGMMKTSATLYGLPTTASPDDPRASAFMGAEYARQNKLALEKATGRPIKDGEFYIMHFMGTPQGVNFVRANESNPGAPAAQLFPKEASYNKSIFYDKDGTPRSVSQVYSKLSSYIDGNTNYTTVGASGSPTNFAPALTSNDLAPTAVPRSQAETMTLNEQQAKRDAEAPWYHAVSDAFSLHSVTGRALSTTPNFSPDASFSMSPAYQKQLMTDYALRPEYQDRFANAVSQPHAEYIAQQSKNEMAKEDHLASYGMGGVALSIFATMADPVAVGAGIASGGLADYAAMAVNAGRIGRIAAQAVAGGATNVGLDYGMRELGDPNAGRDVLMTAAAGALFGAGYGMLSRNPATMAEARQLQQAAGSLKRTLEDTTALTPMRSVGAAENPHVDWPALNDPEWQRLDSDNVARTAMGKGRYDVVGQLKSQDGPASRLAGGALGEDAVGNADHSLNSFAASEEMELFHRQFMGDLRRTWVTGVKEWADAQGYGMFGRLRGGSEFNDLVHSYVINRDPQVQFHGAVAKVGDKIRQLNEEILQLAKNPLQREGLVGRAVQGFEDVPENKFYMMRAYDGSKLNNAIERFSQKGLVKWFTGAIRSAQPQLEDDIIEKIAEGTVKGIHLRANGIDERLNMMMSGFDRAQLEDVLREANVAEDRIKSVLNSVERDSKTGADARAKRRILLDETHVLRNYPTREGGVADLSLKDLVISDASVLSDLYFRHMSGRIALARVRLKNPANGEMLVNGITSDNEWTSFLNRVLKSDFDNGVDKAQIGKNRDNLQFLYDRILGRPDPAAQGSWPTWLRRLRKLNYTRVMGQVGFAQIPEAAMVPAQLGIKAALSHMPAFRRIVSMDGESILRDGLASELEAIFGLGTDRLRGMQFFRHDEYGGHATGVMGKVDNALDFGQAAVSEMSGMTTINAALQRWSGKAIAQKFADMALEPTAANMKRMASLGLDDAMLKRVLGQVQSKFTKEDGMLFKGKVTRMNLDKWDDLEARAAFENSVFRWSRRIIQENDIGNMHRWSSNPLWQMMFQFRSFTLNAWNKQFLHNIHMKDMTSFNIMTTSMVAAAAVYAVQTQLQAMGRSDKDAFLTKRLAPEALAKAAFSRAGWSSIMPMGIDTAARLTGFDPVFDFRTTGQAQDVLFGNPTMGYLDDLSKASKGIVQPMKEGRERSQLEYRNIMRAFPLSNWMPASALLSTMVSNAPERPPNK